jgi:hypothetical protein
MDTHGAHVFASDYSTYVLVVDLSKLGFIFILLRVDYDDI